MAKKIWLLELLGIPFIVIAGSMLHFAFAWSGHWTPVALFAAVNESVWEHLKLAFWPGLLWAIFEYATLRPTAWQFWSAKGIGLLIAPVLIICIFYLYTALLGRNILVLDIATFVVAIALGQIGSGMLINNYVPNYRPLRVEVRCLNKKRRPLLCSRATSSIIRLSA